MKNCLQCEKELTHIEGRKQKSFCNVNCRNKYFYAQRSLLIKNAKAAIGSLPDEMKKDITHIGVLSPKGETTSVTKIATPPTPVKEKNEDAIDFAARKNEWKKLYQK